MVLGTVFTPPLTIRLPSRTRKDDGRRRADPPEWGPASLPKFHLFLINGLTAFHFDTNSVMFSPEVGYVVAQDGACFFR